MVAVKPRQPHSQMLAEERLLPKSPRSHQLAQTSNPHPQKTSNLYRKKKTRNIRFSPDDSPAQHWLALVSNRKKPSSWCPLQIATGIIFCICPPIFRPEFRLMTGRIPVYRITVRVKQRTKTTMQTNKRACNHSSATGPTDTQDIRGRSGVSALVVRGVRLITAPKTKWQRQTMMGTLPEGYLTLNKVCNLPNGAETKSSLYHHPSQTLFGSAYAKWKKFIDKQTNPERLQDEGK
jgi:hypothetical protein